MIVHLGPVLGGCIDPYNETSRVGCVVIGDIESWNSTDFYDVEKRLHETAFAEKPDKDFNILKNEI
jgi:hypothetical protein